MAGLLSASSTPATLHCLLNSYCLTGSCNMASLSNGSRPTLSDRRSQSASSVNHQANSEAGGSRVAHTLTACCRCRNRKTRCDPALPRCGPCERNNALCEYFDTVRLLYPASFDFIAETQSHRLGAGRYHEHTSSVYRVRSKPLKRSYAGCPTRIMNPQMQV